MTNQIDKDHDLVSFSFEERKKSFNYNHNLC